MNPLSLKHSVMARTIRSSNDGSRDESIARCPTALQGCERDVAVRDRDFWF